MDNLAQDKLKRQQEAMDFLMGFRGQYIMAQALHYGIKSLESVDPVRREISNIEHMKYLRENLFTFPDHLFDHDETLIQSMVNFEDILKNREESNHDTGKTGNRDNGSTHTTHAE
jgi:hypothetical protein